VGVENRSNHVSIHVRLRRPFSFRFPDSVGIDVEGVSGSPGIAVTPVTVGTENFEFEGNVGKVLGVGFGIGGVSGSFGVIGTIVGV